MMPVVAASRIEMNTTASASPPRTFDISSRRDSNIRSVTPLSDRNRAISTKSGMAISV